MLRQVYKIKNILCQNILFPYAYVTGEKRRNTKKGWAREQDDRDIGKPEDAIISWINRVSIMHIIYDLLHIDNLFLLFLIMFCRISWENKINHISIAPIDLLIFIIHIQVPIANNNESLAYLQIKRSFFHTSDIRNWTAEIIFVSIITFLSIYFDYQFLILIVYIHY